MSFDHIISLLIGYQYLFLFPVAIFQGPIITIITGFLSTLGYFNPFVAFAVLVSADIAGDIGSYAIGYYGGIGFVRRRGRYIGITPERIEQLDGHFKRHTVKTLLVSKIPHGLGTVVHLAAGVAKVSFKKFLFYSTVFTLPKVLIFLLIGIYFGDAYTRINGILNYTSIGVTVGLVVLIGIYFGSRKYRQRFESEEEK